MDAAQLLTGTKLASLTAFSSVNRLSYSPFDLSFLFSLFSQAPQAFLAELSLCLRETSLDQPLIPDAFIADQGRRFA